VNVVSSTETAILFTVLLQVDLNVYFRIISYTKALLKRIFFIIDIKIIFRSYVL
jgi:hypothetical protein